MQAHPAHLAQAWHMATVPLCVSLACVCVHERWAPQAGITQAERPGQAWARKPGAERSPGCLFPQLQANLQLRARKPTSLWGRQPAAPTVIGERPRPAHFTDNVQRLGKVG